MIFEVPGRYSGEMEHSRGGMGRILLVYDETMERQVVLKEMLPAQSSSDAATETSFEPSLEAVRFLHEAKITGQLEHPSIVPVYEVGQRSDGTLYYTMKFVRGRTLAAVLSEQLTMDERLSLLPHFLQLCQAVAYAHSRGIIHRDLKPSNVMIGSFGETVVIDWGLAKRKDADHRAVEQDTPVEAAADLGVTITVSGTVVGTPRYMAPEQARGEEVDERSDVYSLGAILYEIIIGRPQQPKPMPKLLPTTGIPNAPSELEAICRRALDPEPGQRYSSAKELAEDVGCFLAGALVQAYDYNFGDHLRRFVRRHKLTVLTGSAALVALLVVGFFAYARVLKEKSVSDAERVTAQQARDRAETSQAEAVSARDEAKAERAEALHALYNARISLAQNCVVQSQYGRALDLLEQCPPDLLNWEWGWLLSLCCEDSQSYIQDDPGRGNPFAAAPGNGLLLLQMGNNALQMVSGRRNLNLLNLQMRDHAMRGYLSPNGEYLAVLAQENYRGIYRTADSELLFTLDFLQGDWEWQFAFSDDSQRFIVRASPEQVDLWELKTAQKLASYSVAGLKKAWLSPNGGRVCLLREMMEQDQVRQVLASANDAGQVLTESDCSELTALAFSGDSQRVFAGYRHGLLEQRPLADFSQASRLSVQTSPVTAIAVAASGTLAAAWENGEAAVWIDPSKEPEILQEAGGVVARTLAVAEDGRRVAAGYDDAKVRLWTLNEGARFGEPPQVFQGHSSSILSLQFDASGETLYSFAKTEAKIWSCAHVPTQMDYLQDSVHAVCFAGISRADGAVVTITKQGESYLWDGALGKPGECQWSLPFSAAPDSVLLSADGRMVAVQSSNAVDIWDVQSRQVNFSRSMTSGAAIAAALAPDSGRVAILWQDLLQGRVELEILEAKTGAPLASAAIFPDYQFKWPWKYAAMTFTPDGSAVAVAAEEAIALYDAKTATERAVVAVPTLNSGSRNLICFSPTGFEAAITLQGNRVSLIDFATNGSREIPMKHDSPVTALCYTADGTRLVTGAASGALHLWETRNGREMANLGSMPSSVEHLSFDGCGLDLFVSGSTGAIRFIRAFDWKEGSYPGDKATPFEQRVSAYKTYHPRVAGAWGRCQMAMHKLADTGSVPGEHACPEGGRIGVGTAETLPRCSIHGPLSNRNYLLQLVRELDSLVPEEELRAKTLAHRIFAALDSAKYLLQQELNAWLSGKRHFRSALFLAREYDLVDGRLGLAALEAGEFDAAVRMLERVTETKGMGAWGDRPNNYKKHLALAYAKRALPGDWDRAYACMERYLSYYVGEDPEVEDVLRALEQQESSARTARLRLLYQFPAGGWKQLPWIDDLQQAQEESARSGKPIFLEVGAEHSSLTRQVRETIYSHPIIQEQLSARYVLCSLDAMAHAEIMEQLHILEPPVHCLLDAQRHLLSEIGVPATLLHFDRAYLHDFRDYVSDWRLLGKFAEDSTARQEQPNRPEAELQNAEIDFGRSHATIGAEGFWRTYTCQPQYKLVPLEGLFQSDTTESVYACFSFTLPREQEVALDVYLIGAATLWVDGQTVWKKDDFGQDCIERTLKLSAGRHVVLMKLVQAVILAARITDPGHQPVAGLEFSPLPPCPPIFYTRDYLQPIRQELDLQGDNITRVRVSQDEVLREWRRSYADILAKINPRPFYQDGAVIGFHCERPEDVPLVAQLGFKNGDIVVGVNGFKAADAPVLDIAKKTEGSEEYDVEVLREGRTIHILIGVDRQ
jgi:WD40 repeat protein/tRNA A-37 threonylcarbamoyl transferase component Bud32